jgi:RHS repeat-associated protein
MSMGRKVLNEKYEYDPWGQIISSYQPTPLFTNYRYQGKKRGNNLDNFGARNHDALGIGAGSSMRWISADPVTSNINDPQSLNKYIYVRNDPVNMIDPDGRRPIKIHIDVWAPGPGDVQDVSSYYGWDWAYVNRTYDIEDNPRGGAPKRRVPPKLAISAWTNNPFLTTLIIKLIANCGFGNVLLFLNKRVELYPTCFRLLPLLMIT